MVVALTQELDSFVDFLDKFSLCLFVPRVLVQDEVQLGGEVLFWVD